MAAGPRNGRGRRINASGTQTKKDPNRWYELEQESERPLEAVAPKTELVRGTQAPSPLRTREPLFGV